jgi:hypothetical protein
VCFLDPQACVTGILVPPATMFLEPSSPVCFQQPCDPCIWLCHLLVVPAGLRDGPPSTISDRVFENELNIAVFRSKEAYDKLLFREALKCAGYDLTNARDVYRCVYVRAHSTKKWCTIARIGHPVRGLRPDKCTRPCTGGRCCVICRSHVMTQNKAQLHVARSCVNYCTAISRLTGLEGMC